MNKTIQAEVYEDRNIFVLNFDDTKYYFTASEALKKQLEFKVNILRLSDYTGTVKVDVQRKLRKYLFIEAEYAINTTIEGNSEPKTRPYNSEHSLRIYGDKMITVSTDTMPKWYALALDLESSVLKGLPQSNSKLIWDTAVKLAKEITNESAGSKK
jgi:hypothetical protein